MKVIHSKGHLHHSQSTQGSTLVVFCIIYMNVYEWIGYEYAWMYMDIITLFSILEKCLVICHYVECCEPN